MLLALLPVVPHCPLPWPPLRAAVCRARDAPLALPAVVEGGMMKGAIRIGRRSFRMGDTKRKDHKQCVKTFLHVLV